MRTLNRVAIPFLSLWLLGWIVLSWGAIQDDALIHLRYADRLLHVHFISYDGTHPSYGTSSLLYVSLLALLRVLTRSALLSRAVSTAVHVLLFAVMAVTCLRTSRSSARVQLLALSTVLLLVTPSAVRWLDDGMETGLVVSLALIVAAYTHRLSMQTEVRFTQILITVLLGVLMVFLRVELGIALAFATGILWLHAAAVSDSGWSERLIRALTARSGFLIGATVGASAIGLIMHHLLPDTAVAKASGIRDFFSTFRRAGHIIVGGLLFGVGSLFLWLLSAVAVLRNRGPRRLTNLTANLLFPVVLLLCAVRGQAIQGVRYLIWTFLFSIVWNLLELWKIDETILVQSPSRPGSQRSSSALFAAFLGFCLITMPIDVHYMARTLTTRANTMKLFMREDLSPILSTHLGMASDIGYIGYYTNSPICDLAGLVNGRTIAALTPAQRIERCTGLHPDYLFADTSQVVSIAHYLDLSTWRVCGVYDFGNTLGADSHYLIVRPSLAAATCQAAGYPGSPTSIAFTERKYR